MDEEDDPLDTIYERIQRGVEELATGEVKVIDEETEERVRIYTAKYGGRDFVLIGDFENSKAAWKSINHNRQLEIFNALKNNREMVKRVFPQQVQGCGYLMGAHPKIGNR